MTSARQARWPARSAIVRAVELVAAVSTLAVLLSVAHAQGWEPTVSTGEVSAPKASVRQAPKQTAQKMKPATPFAVVVEKEIMPALADVSAKTSAAKAPPADTAKLETGSIKGPNAEEYCSNIADPAADARFAWQKKTLAEMEQEIVKRIALLEEKTAEYQKWLARRDEFSQKANETILRIYSRMRPDAAAVQLAALDEETAASIITKLEPKTASLILNDMDPAQAVRLTATISGAGKVAPAPKPAPEAKSK